MSCLPTPVLYVFRGIQSVQRQKLMAVFLLEVEECAKLFRGSERINENKIKLIMVTII